MSTRVRILAAITIAAACALAVPARAQLVPPPPDQPDLTIDASLRALTIDSLATAIDRQYVFPDVGKQVAKTLRERSKKGRYDSITSAKAFNDTLNSELRALAHDLHLRTHYYHAPVPQFGGQNTPPSDEERAVYVADARRRNYGLDRVQRLPGNVGYIELRGFESSAEAGVQAQAAMQTLAYCDALIFDLRRNGGGDPNMIVLFLSYLYDGDERVHVNDFYQREGNHTEEYWTTTTVPGPRFAGKPVYVLTSSRTGSAAEEFAYDIKNLKRGTLVGETTAGGANPGGYARLNDHFVAFIAGGRAINPVSKTNWEGVGVTPDVKVETAEALKTAHVAAVTALLDKATDADRKASLGRALEAAKSGAN